MFKKKIKIYTFHTKFNINVDFQLLTLNFDFSVVYIIFTNENIPSVEELNPRRRIQRFLNI